MGAQSGGVQRRRRERAAERKFGEAIVEYIVAALAVLLLWKSLSGGAREAQGRRAGVAGWPFQRGRDSPGRCRRSLVARPPMLGGTCRPLGRPRETVRVTTGTE